MFFYENMSLKLKIGKYKYIDETWFESTLSDGLSPALLRS